MSAVLYGDTASVGALLDGGADVNAHNDAGATALMWAVTDLEKTRRLVERAPTSTRDPTTSAHR
jgi:ankyrin repeat protein